MASVGLLETAWRVVDDLEILLCLCRVYLESKPWPSRRRVVKALLRAMSEERGVSVLPFWTLAPRQRLSDEESSSYSPRRVEENLDDDDEAVFASSGETVAEAFVVNAHQHRPNAFMRRILDELALFGSWCSVTSAVISYDVSKPAPGVALGFWLLARLASAGAFDMTPMPKVLMLAYRAVLAHPLERQAIRSLAPSGSSPAGVWAGWRGAILAAVLESQSANLGLASGPRLRGLLHLDVTRSHVLIHAKACIRALPLAVASVLAARAIAFVFFGASHLEDVAKRIARRSAPTKRSRGQNLRFGQSTSI